MHRCGVQPSRVAPAATSAAITSSTGSSTQLAGSPACVLRHLVRSVGPLGVTRQQVVDMCEHDCTAAAPCAASSCAAAAHWAQGAQQLAGLWRQLALGKPHLQAGSGGEARSKQAGLLACDRRLRGRHFAAELAWLLRSAAGRQPDYAAGAHLCRISSHKQRPQHRTLGVCLLRHMAVRSTGHAI